jgi:lycopene beta-cyclase
MKKSTIGIRGAGLSGLSVARELLRLDPTVKISIFDTRARLPHPPRTFCFFKAKPLSHSSVPSFSWNTVMFRGSSFERRLDVSSRPYTMIRGDDFFPAILRELEEAGVEFHWGCQSVEIVESSIRADGETREFHTVIDAAFQAHTAEALLWQSFAGVWITSHKALFDPGTAMLMDLQESSPTAPVSFLYILPTSERTALIEHTTFSPSPMPKSYHLDRCFAWLDNNHAGEVLPGATEYGLIPMGLQTTGSSEHLLVGSTAGVVRPATGYAFIRAQEHARQVAQRVLATGTPSPHPYPRWLTMADTLFLQALLNAPDKGGYMMERLLSRARADSLVAFLSGDVRLLDALSVWLSVPKYTMLRSLLRV